MYLLGNMCSLFHDNYLFLISDAVIIKALHHSALNCYGFILVVCYSHGIINCAGFPFGHIVGLLWLLLIVVYNSKGGFNLHARLLLLMSQINKNLV